MATFAIFLLCTLVLIRLVINFRSKFNKKSDSVKSEPRNPFSKIKQLSTLTTKLKHLRKFPTQPLTYLIIWREQHLNLTKFFSIDLEINGVDISGHIDTLSNISLIHKEVLKKLKLKRRPSPNFKLLLANNKSIKIESQVMMKIRSPRNEFETVFLNAFVVENLHFSVILGSDFHTKAYTIIDFSNNSVKFGIPTDFWTSN